MTLEDLRVWLGGRLPEIPTPFLPVLLDYHSDTASLLDSHKAGGDGLEADHLGRLGEAAMEEALSHPGRDRTGAFALLAGDAFLTYACELLAESAHDVPAALDHMIRRLGRRFS